MQPSEKSAMDFVGQAIVQLLLGEKGDLYFLSSEGEREKYEFDRYRDGAKYSTLEKLALSSLKGSVLDIGCGTAAYHASIPDAAFMHGIDVCEVIVQYATSRHRNCFAGDIFAVTAGQRYDSILLLDNNIGIAGTEDRLYLLLDKLHKNLKPEGNIIAHCRKGKESGAITEESRAVWRGIISHPFFWLTVDEATLQRIAGQTGFNYVSLGEDGTHYLAKLTRQGDERPVFPSAAETLHAALQAGMDPYLGSVEGGSSTKTLSYVIDDFLKVKPDAFGNRIKYPRPPDLVTFRGVTQFGAGISREPNPKCTIFHTGTTEHYWLEGPEKFVHAWKVETTETKEYHPTITNILTGMPTIAGRSSSGISEF